MLFQILLNDKFNLTIIKNKKNNLYIYNKYYYFIIKFNKKNFKKIYISKKINNIILIFLKNKINIKNINFLKKILKNWFLLFFKKIKFTGKGFRIKKNKKKINFLLEFNKSHLTIFILKKIILKKIKKAKFLILWNNLKYLNKLNKKIININKINKYTKRGLRNSRQLIKKKTNKKSIIN